MTIPTSSRLWPPRYRHPPETWIRCAVCVRIGQVSTMTEMTQVRRWAASSKMPEVAITPPVSVWVCAEPSEACRHAQERYCR